jgi:hypothetical protein
MDSNMKLVYVILMVFTKKKSAALIKWERVEVRRNVIGARIADDENNKLISVEPSRVYCDNDAWNA